MKIVNTTDFSDLFLRRLVSWCCRQIELPVNYMARATFRNKADGYSGRGGGLSIIVSIGRTGFPYGPDTRDGMDNETYADRLECLVAITAHELEHCRQGNEGRMHTLRMRRRLEPMTRAVEVRVLRAFRADREALLAAWNLAPPVRPRKPKPTAEERNEAKAREALARWERKLKLAKTKVTGYRRKVSRYDRQAASRGQR